MRHCNIKKAKTLTMHRFLHFCIVFECPGNFMAVNFIAVKFDCKYTKLT